MNYGLGVDSTAWLLLLMQTLPDRARVGDASAREAVGLPADADLDRLFLITAMTGSEHPRTAGDVTEHMLPRFTEHQMRFVQVARPRGGRQGQVVVLNDSAAPTVLYAAGRYRLYTEMTSAGTVPTTGLARKCSIKAKGWPIDAFLDAEFGTEPFYQVMGFENSKHERGRAKRDAREGDGRGRARTGVYPLIEIEWDRDRCEEFIFEKTAVRWRKSACTFCPYRLTNMDGLAEVLAEWREWPELALEPLVMDFASVALNPKMGLVAGKSLWSVIAPDPTLDEAMWLAEEHLEGLRWGVYEVRRGFKAAVPKDGSRVDPYKRGYSARQTVRLASGTQEAMRAALEAMAIGRRLEVDRSDPLHPRVWVKRRADVYPTREHFLVAAPAFIDEKQGNGFEGTWEAGEFEPDVPRQVGLDAA